MTLLHKGIGLAAILLPGCGRGDLFLDPQDCSAANGGRCSGALVYCEHGVIRVEADRTAARIKCELPDGGAR